MKQRRTSEEAERTVGERHWGDSGSGSGDGLRDVGVRDTRLLMRARDDKRDFQVSGGVSGRHFFRIGCLFPTCSPWNPFLPGWTSSGGCGELQLVWRCFPVPPK